MQDEILNATQWKDKGNQFFQQKNYPKALEYYEEAIKLKQDFKEALLNKGFCYKEMGNEPSALTSFSQAIAIDPLYVKAIYNKATLLFSQNKFQIALETIDKYLSQGGNDNSLVKLRKQYADKLVKTILGEGASLNPNKLFQEAQKYKNNNDYENARKYSKAVLVLSPQHVETKALLSQLEKKITTYSPALFKPVKKVPAESAVTPQWKAKKYFYVKQGHYSTWQYNTCQPKSLECGFYLEGFYNCLIIIIKNKNSGKVAAIHADESIIREDIKNLITWAGEDSEKTIYLKNCKMAKESLDDLFEEEIEFRKSFILKFIEPKKENGKLVLDRRGKILPDGTPLIEFESNIIWVDYYNDFGTRDDDDTDTELVELIDDDGIIKNYYYECEMAVKKAIPNKRGSVTYHPKSACSTYSQYEDKILLMMDKANDNYGEIRAHLDMGLEINICIKGYTMLALAAAGGHEEVVDLLLSRGATVDKPIELPDDPNNNGTPLFYAANGGYINVVKKLLKEGADPNYKTRTGSTPITIALINGHKEIAELLVSYRTSKKLQYT